MAQPISGNENFTVVSNNAVELQSLTAPLVNGQLKKYYSVSLDPSDFDVWYDVAGATLLPATSASDLPTGLSTFQFALPQELLIDSTKSRPVIKLGSLNYDVTNVAAEPGIVGCSLVGNATMTSITGVVVTINSLGAAASPANLLPFDFVITYSPQ